MDRSAVKTPDKLALRVITAAVCCEHAIHTSDANTGSTILQYFIQDCPTTLQIESLNQIILANWPTCLTGPTAVVCICSP